MNKKGESPSFFIKKFSKRVDKPRVVLYNKDRSEEDRKTLGPTADLRIFKLYVFIRTTTGLRHFRALKYYSTKVVWIRPYNFIALKY